MNVDKYRENRARIPVAELMKLQNQWVAFSMDGSAIIAAHEDLARLDSLLVSAGINPEMVALERIDLGDTCLGGAELA